MGSAESILFAFTLKGIKFMKFPDSKKIFQITAIFICISLYLPATAQEKKLAGSKAAEINGVVITKEQFDKELNVHLDRVSRQGKQAK